MFIVQPPTHNTNRQPTQCTQLGIESQLNPRTSSYQTSFQQPIYHSVPAQTFDTQDFQHLINSQFDHPQSIRSLSPNKGLQYLFPSACDDAELAGGLSHLSDPEMLDIRSPLLQYSKSETESPAVNTIELHPIPAATFYKPFIFRKTLPAGNNNKSHEETNNNKNTDECKHSVLNHNILGATNEINDAVQKKSKSIRRRKQPLKKEQKENDTTPDKQSRLPNTIISQSPGTPSTTAPTGIKNATKKTKKSKGPALVTKSLVAAEMSNQNESALNQLSIKSTSKSLAPKTHKRPMKHLSNDVTIVRESNQLSIMKNAAADADVINDSITCPVPKKKRRKKVTDNEVHKGIKSGSAGPNIVLDATVINEKSEVDLNRRNGERPKHNLQENVGNNVTVQNDEEGHIRDEPLDTVGVNAGAEWKTSFDKLVKCVIKGFTVNREASARGLNALHKFTVNPSNRHVDIVRKDFLATLIRCVSPKVKLTVNEVLTRHGVFTFDVDVLGVDFVNYPKVKVQLTPDYPADLPVFLDLESTKDSIENAENKRKFVYAISLMRKKLRTIPDHCYRLPVVIKIWSQALRFVTIHNVALQIEDRDERIMHTLLK
ncbi:unnamed protein product [Orchesella dallaii]|uniref:Uncharacterized protein n=1 Tax=Orchesella dallaii TaxID=48710 RepID=A0ABP1QA66_9HEXA